MPTGPRLDPGRGRADLLVAVRAGPLSIPTLPLSRDVLAHSATLSPHEPVMLPFTEIDPDFKARHCHVNVIEQVRREGGTRVQGWMVWANPRFVDAEFHCVWQPEGSTELVDLTPRVDGEKEVLFVRDDVTKITNRDGRDYLPANRTNIPNAPFTVGSMVMEKSSYAIEYDYQTAAQMKRYGVASLA